MRAFRRFARGFIPVLATATIGGRAAAAEQSPGTVEASPSDPPTAASSPDPPEEPLLPPPGARWDLLIAGLAITGVSYGAALGASYAWPSARTADELRIPVVGPWMAIADTGCKENEPDCSTVLLVFTAILTGVDGVIQAGGLGMALESAFLPTAPARRRAGPSPVIRPVPYVAGTDALGLGLAGTF